MAKRWYVLVAALAGLAVVGFLAGPSLARQVLHFRDVAAFQTYVVTYVDGWGSSLDPGGPARDLAWVKAHPDIVLAEGDRACVWLADQPAAPAVDPTGESAFDTVFGRYLSTTKGTSLTKLSPQGRSTVVAGAWEYLCHNAREAATAPRSLQEDD